MWAIVIREVRQQFRVERSSTVVVAVVYLLLCIVLFFINYVLIGSRHIGLKEAFESFWLHMLALQYFLVHIIGSFKVATSVVRERTSKRLEFETMSGISEWASVFGRIIGAPLFCYFLVAISVVFALFCHFAGDVDGYTILKNYLLLISSAFLFYTFAILASVLTRSIFSALVSVSLFILLIYSLLFLTRVDIDELAAFSPLLPFSSVLGIAEPTEFLFGGAVIPAWVASVIFHLFLGYWFLVAAARTLKLPRHAPLSKPHSLVLLILIQLGIIMVFWHTADAVSEVVFGIFIYLAVTFLLSLMFAFMLIRPAIATVGKPLKNFLRGLFYTDAPYMPFFVISALVSFLLLFFGFYKHHRILLSPSRNALLAAVGMFLLLLLFYILLVKFMTAVAGERGRMIAAFTLLILVVLPPVLEVFDRESGFSLIQVLNPLIVIATPLQPFPLHRLAVSQTTMLITALVVYGVASLLIAVVLKMWWGRRDIG